MKDVSLDPALAVAVVPNGATAYLALTQIARMHDGERVLVHGALGGLAAGFPGIARQLGASRVTGTVRASDLNAAQQAELPYDEIVDSAELPARLAGERFDIVVDPVGGSVRTTSLDLPGGRSCVISRRWAAAHPGRNGPNLLLLVARHRHTMLHTGRRKAASATSVLCRPRRRWPAACRPG